MLTSKDRGLVAQIAGHIAANYPRSGRPNVKPESIAEDSVTLAIAVLEATDGALARLPAPLPVPPPAPRSIPRGGDAP